MFRHLTNQGSTPRTIKLGGLLSLVAAVALVTPGCFLFSYDTRGVEVLNEDAKEVKVVRADADVASCQGIGQIRKVAVGHMNQNDLVEALYNAVKNDAATKGADTILVKTDPPANAAGWFGGDTSDSDRKDLDAFFEACDSTSQCYQEENASWSVYCRKDNRCEQAADPADGTNVGGLRYTITAAAYKCN